MKAKEVLAQYAQGERDFHRVDLRGQSFKGQNLSGADFRGADIRGTNFTGANLTGTNFQEAEAGLQKRWVMLQLLFSFVLAAISGFGSMLAGAMAALIFESTNLENQIIGWLALVGLLVSSIIILRQGINFALSTVAVAITSSIAVKLAIAFAVAVAVVIATAVAIAFAITVAIAFASSVLITVAIMIVVSISIAFLASVAFSVTVAITVSVAITSSIAVTVALLIAAALTILSTYTGWQAMKRNKKYVLIKTVAVTLAAIGGTSFRQANLTEADFTKAILKNTDFRRAIFTHTYWNDAFKLDLARLGNTYLNQKPVRELILTKNGYKKSYQGLNLRGANLAGINLEAANLKQADLGEANLRQANLKNANLTEINAVATDFTNSTLTGACLEAWNIDHTTKLKNIDCQYVYLLEHPNLLGNRERRPHDPDSVFQPGDFSQLFQEVLNVVQLLIRDGLNPEAFQQAFQKIMTEHPGVTPDSIQEIKRKGKDVFVTLEVPEETDKGRLEKDFNEVYQARLEAEAQKNAELLQAANIRAEEMTKIALALANQNLSLNVDNSNKVENNLNNS